MRAPEPGTAALAAAALLPTLAVIAASAFIRLSAAEGPAVSLARGVHRLSASLAGLFVLLLAAYALWRRTQLAPALGALSLVVFLAVLGRAAGSAPPPPAALGNLLGGLALAALLAWLLGRARAPLEAGTATRRLATGALAAAAALCAFGGWSAVFAAGTPALALELVRELAGALALCALAQLRGRIA